MRRIPLIEKSYQQSLAARNGAGINPALEVAAIGFKDYNGQLLGVLSTPWFMGLILLPVEIEGWRDYQTGDCHTEQLPAGAFEFTHDWNPLFGAYASCPLFSPMDEFADQAAACRMAERAMVRLFTAPVVEPSVTEIDASPQQESSADSPQAAEEIIDTRRRGLLTGDFFNRR